VTFAEDNVATVQTLSNEQIATTSVDVLLAGDDGFVAITGTAINSGITVIAPE